MAHPPPRSVFRSGPHLELRTAVTSLTLINLGAMVSIRVWMMFSHVVVKELVTFERPTISMHEAFDKCAPRLQNDENNRAKESSTLPSPMAS